MPMIRALAIVLSLTLLTACMTTDHNVSAKSEKLRNARASATPMVLGTAY